MVSPKVWRLADLGAKHAFLKAGLGWGAMPLELVRDDIDGGTLVPLPVQAFGPAERFMQMFAAWREDAPPGPAGRWLIAQLRTAGSSAVDTDGPAARGKHDRRKRPRASRSAA